MTDRLALLRAILDRPADDTPRLVYADWLDDHAASDADVARAEFIRFWYDLKPNMRSTTRSIAEWLAANWKRLWPDVAAAANRGCDAVRAQGRVLGGQLEWHSPHRGNAITTFKAHFDRGFVKLLQFDDGWGYEHFWKLFANAEPVARWMPTYSPRIGGPNDLGTTIHEDGWGTAVFDRVTGHSGPIAERYPTGPRTKHFAELPGLDMASLRAWQAIGAAMTAMAQEANGLIPPPA